MARLRTACPDLQMFNVQAGPNGATGSGGTGNAPTFDTGTVRDATRQRASIKCAVGANAGWSMPSWSTGLAVGNSGFDRFYAWIPSSVGFPTGSGGAICQLTTAGSVVLLEIRVSSSGVASLWSQNVQVGTGTSQLVLDTWHRFEMKLLVPASGNGTLALLIDGSTVVADTSVNVGTTAAPLVWLGAIGPNNANITNFTVNLIDIAFNDSTGAAQTSYPGAAIVGACLPISDNSRTGWTGGAAGTTSLFDAVNNTPPVGKALASATDLTQIKRLAANTTDNYVANLGAYTAALASGGAGLAASDTVAVVQSVLSIGQSSSTATNFGQTLTNPTIAELTASAPSAVAGVYPSNWADVLGTVTYAPTVTLGSSPTLKVRKNTSSSSITQMVALMALIVESVPVPNLTPAAISASAATAPLSATTAFSPAAASAAATIATLNQAFLTSAAGAAASASITVSAPALLTATAQSAASATVPLAAPSLIAPSAQGAAATSAPVMTTAPLAPSATSASSATVPLGAASLLAPSAQSAASAQATMNQAFLAPASVSDAAASIPLSAATRIVPTAQSAASAQAGVTTTAPLTPTASSASSASAPVSAATFLSLSAASTATSMVPLTAPSLITLSAASAAAAQAETSQAFLAPTSASTSTAVGGASASGPQQIVPSAGSACSATVPLTASSLLDPSAALSAAASVPASAPALLDVAASSDSTAQMPLSAGSLIVPSAQSASASVADLYRAFLAPTATATASAGAAVHVPALADVDLPVALSLKAEQATATAREHAATLKLDGTLADAAISTTHPIAAMSATLLDASIRTLTPAAALRASTPDGAMSAQQHALALDDSETAASLHADSPTLALNPVDARAQSAARAITAAMSTTAPRVHIGTPTAAVALRSQPVTATMKFEDPELWIDG